MSARGQSAIATTNLGLLGLLESSRSLHQSSPELHQPLQGFIQPFSGINQSLPDAYQSLSDAKNPANAPFIHFSTTKTQRHQVLKREFLSLCLGVLVVKPLN